jgi:hypothetical protein
LQSVSSTSSPESLHDFPFQVRPGFESMPYLMKSADR